MSDSAYETDLYAWCLSQASLLRSNDWTRIDRENLAEEIEALARSERRELRHRLTQLVMHLLKYRFQSESRSAGWRGSIREQRSRLEAVLEDNPSLRPTLPDVLQRVFPTARRAALEETGLLNLPETCPFSLEDILRDDFYPD